MPVAILLLDSMGSSHQSRAVMMLPMVLPPVVGGVALPFAFGRRGTLGSARGRKRSCLPYSLGGVVLARLSPCHS